MPDFKIDVNSEEVEDAHELAQRLWDTQIELTRIESLAKSLRRDQVEALLCLAEEDWDNASIDDDQVRMSSAAERIQKARGLLRKVPVRYA